MSDSQKEPEKGTNSVRRRSRMYEPKQNKEVPKEKITINKSEDISKKFEEALKLKKLDSMNRKGQFNEYNYEDFSGSSTVKDNINNIEKALQNLNKHSKLKELNDKIVEQLYDDNSKRSALSVEEKIHLFDRKINNCEIKEKVLLNLTIKNPDSKCKYDIEVLDEDNNLIAKNDKNNEFNFEIFFSFYIKQFINIIIKKYEDNQMTKKSEMKIPLSKILKDKDEDNFEEEIKDFENNEIINIGYDVPQNEEDEKYIKIHFETEDSNTKYMIYQSNISYAIQKDNKIFFKSAMCHDSNIKKSDKIPLSLLKPKFDIAFYNNDFEENKFTVSADELENGILRTIDFPDISKRIKMFSTKEEKTSFIKLRKKKGLNLEFSIAIDFTASNGPPKFDDNSLHKIKDGFVNNYEKAIRAFYDIISSYNKNDSYYVYGFGADVNGVFSSCFNIKDDNKKISGIENIINSYKDTLNKVELSAGTFFAPVINKINEIIKEEKNNKKNNYHILLIISDGFFEDMEQIVDAILESSKLPLSIIIIGVGMVVINDMKRLNGEYGKLISSKGEVLEKDIIQYVHYNDYADNIQKLTDDVLRNIPNQISDYYEQK